MKHDVVIIGAGHNGLVTAWHLAKAGLKALVLERRDVVGGTAITEEIAPGFRCSSVFHSAGPLLSHVVKDLQLDRHGLELLQPPVRLTALNPAGEHICLFEEPAKTAAALERISSADANRYREFANSFARIGKVLRPLINMTPPALDNPRANEMWDVGKIGLAFKGLGKKDAYRLLRWGPMAVADLAAEWFETEPLRAAVAARGIFCSFAGPWSAGTSAALLWQAAMDGQAISPASFIKGGLGAVTQVLAQAAISAGVEIRTGDEVKMIKTDEEQVSHVVLKDGTEIQTRAVVSSADPRNTFLNLVDPLDLDPNFMSKIANYRSMGSVAKVNLALSALPKFAGVNNPQNVLTGRIHVGDSIDYLERAFDAAKYGDYSPQPYLDITIPSLLDESLAPSGAHVMSIHAQFAPYNLREGDWNARREEFGDHVVNMLADYVPDIKSLIVARKVITPLDLEQTYGLSGGHLMHGEQSLDQFFTFRPLIGWAQYKTPIKGLYLCGGGTHPGGGVTGGPGANASREIIKDLRRRK